MLRCDRCGALWFTTQMSGRQIDSLKKKHDAECDFLQGGDDG